MQKDCTDLVEPSKLPGIENPMKRKFLLKRNTKTTRSLNYKNVKRFRCWFFNLNE